jgi:hypothetical protein
MSKIEQRLNRANVARFCGRDELADSFLDQIPAETEHRGENSADDGPGLVEMVVELAGLGPECPDCGGPAINGHCSNPGRHE